MLRCPCLARLAVLALCIGWGAPVLAGPPAEAAGVEFAWDAPSECPSEAEVEAELERLLGGPVAEQGERRLSAIARVRREADGAWDLRLWTVTADATRQRSMVGEDCAVLAEAAALLAAMAIDPSVLERMGASEAAVEQAEQAEELEAEAEPEEPAPEEPEPRVEPEPEPEVPPPKAEPNPDPEPSERRLGIGIRAHGGMSYGDLPGLGAIVRVALALNWDRARFELEGHYAFARHAPLDDGSNRGAKLQLAFAAARGCAVLRHRPSKLEFPLCAGLEGGAALGEGVGLDEVRRAAVPWLAVDLAPGLVWAPTRRLAIGLAIEPWVALTRRRFEIDNVGVIWRPLPAGVRASAGLEVRF
ncbi:MAG: hypothetical protein R6X02_29830 [Enhygromyxa sp.]